MPIFLKIGTLFEGSQPRDHVLLLRAAVYIPDHFPTTIYHYAAVVETGNSSKYSGEVVATARVCFSITRFA